MPESIQREVILFTPNKKYTGKIDLKNDGIRTIDQLNSSTIYWKNPAEKSFDDAVLLYDVDISVHGVDKLTSFKKLQVRLSDIMFFTDRLETSGIRQKRCEPRPCLPKPRTSVPRLKL